MSREEAIVRGSELLAILAAAGAIVAVQYAFQRRTCAQSAGGACTPNVAYLGVAVLAIVTAGVAVGVRRRVR